MLGAILLGSNLVTIGASAVSYTHLDVYKRQSLISLELTTIGAAMRGVTKVSASWAQEGLIAKKDAPKIEKYNDKSGLENRMKFI